MTTATATTTRHAVRCSMPGCSSFTRDGHERCKSCELAFAQGVVAGRRMEVAFYEPQVTAAREAAVADHAAHQEQAEHLHAERDDLREQLIDCRKEIADRKAGEKDLTEALALANENLDDSAKRNAFLIRERDEARKECDTARARRDEQFDEANRLREEVGALTRREANTDLLCEQLATRTRERDEVLGNAITYVAQRDARAAEADRWLTLSRWLAVAVVALAIPYLPAVWHAISRWMGWGR